jgi:hypothetical protein
MGQSYVNLSQVTHSTQIYLNIHQDKRKNLEITLYLL